MSLRDKRVVVGVGGGIAAFKAVELVRELGRRGAEVRVAMTKAGARFVGPVTFTGLTGRPAVTDLWNPAYAGEVHVDLATWADAIVVAPATANLLARAAAGLADDAVLATLACADCPVLYAPAMHSRMWNRPATRRSILTLAQDGALVVAPVSGPLANGEVGEGRMREPVEIADALTERLAAAGEAGDLTGRRVLVTAGPTVEDLDPVRYLSNRSSGRMGFAVADAARARGAEVTLVSGPVTLHPPAGVQLVPVRSAVEMHGVVQELSESVDVVVMAAAVADYRPAEPAPQKIKKGKGPMRLELVRNPDILAALGEARSGALPILVGFAVESEALAGRAKAKLDAKGCDLVVANHADVGFAGDDEAVLVDAHGSEALPRMRKRGLADRVLDRVVSLLDPAAPTSGVT